MFALHFDITTITVLPGMQWLGGARAVHDIASLRYRIVFIATVSYRRV